VKRLVMGVVYKGVVLVWECVRLLVRLLVRRFVRGGMFTGCGLG
jgi:hypothetical protein